MVRVVAAAPDEAVHDAVVHDAVVHDAAGGTFRA
jgi:hypothetical protein